MATTLKGNLQKDVFRITEEKLVHVLELKDSNKENTKRYLCTSVTTGNDVSIIWLSITEEGSVTNYVRKYTWLLKEMTLIDGIDASKDSAIFDMHFGNDIYTLEACSTASKYAFLRYIRKMSHEYLQCDLRWRNFDHDFVGNNSSFLVPDDITLTIKICLEAFGCVCLFGCV
ncbi:exocyst complex component 1-like [Pelodytes ibericus]